MFIQYVNELEIKVSRKNSEISFHILELITTFERTQKVTNETKI